MCRKTIKAPYQHEENARTHSAAQKAAKNVPGVAMCLNCEPKFRAMVDRAESSMQPSTGEGDYLPPAGNKAANRLSDAKVGDLRTDSKGFSYRVTDIKVGRNRSGAYIVVSGRCVEDVRDGNATAYGSYRYELAYDTVVGETPEKEEKTMTDSKITPEVIEALRTLRNKSWASMPHLLDSIDVLDNAGIFAAIDEATGYDVDPEPEQVSKCTCSSDFRSMYNTHAMACPGDPAEWGDMAFITAPTTRKVKDRRPCPADQCTLSFAVNKDGTLHKHLNDMLRPCPGVASDTKES